MFYIIIPLLKMNSPETRTENLTVTDDQFVTVGNGTGPTHRYFVTSHSNLPNILDGASVISLKLASVLGLLGASIGTTISGIDESRVLKIVDIQPGHISEINLVPSEP